MNCPTCGLLNLPSARFCIHCKSLIDSTSRPPSPPTGNIIELRRLRTDPSTAGGAQAQRAPAPQSDWREQLSLKLDRMEETSSEGSEAPTTTPNGDFRQREFVRPGASPVESESTLTPRRSYHPLAEKALEKIDRTKPSSAEQVLELPIEPPTRTTAPDVALATRRRRTERRGEKPERIEIDLNQPALPFEAGQDLVAKSSEDEIRPGLAAAPLGSRVRAGLIDSLFVFGCFLIFLLIVFFVPEFVLFTRSSIVGMGLVLLLIFLSYVVTFTILGAKTLGMDHEELEVVTYAGSAITPQDAWLRCFGYLVSLGCFGLGFLWAAFDPEGLTWHDKISKTLVVYRTSVSPNHSGAL
ncbi:MAG: RDD family protein [Acidimicrobiia bacterium]|nr:RDD family protein [Acidimicrobiia bacterium]